MEASMRLRLLILISPLMWVPLNVLALEVRSATPNPAELCLRAAADDTLTSDMVTEQIESALRSQVRGLPEHLQRVLVVVGSEGSSKSRLAVKNAIAAAEARGSTALRDYARRIRTAEAQPQLTAGNTDRADESPEAPAPTAAERRRTGGGAQYQLSVRRFVDQLLPRESGARVAEVATAVRQTSCEALFEGKAVEVCADIGITDLKTAAVLLAFSGLSGSEGDPRFLERYLSLSKEDLQELSTNIQILGSDQLWPYAVLLRRWSHAKPSRWQAWADIEEVIGPR